MAGVAGNYVQAL